MPIQKQFHHPWRGYEFDWVALDRQGRLGYFATAGDGWVPELIKDSTSRYEDVIDLIRQLPVVAAPVISYGKGSKHGEYNLNKSNLLLRDLTVVAERGIFGFDWSPYTENYELVTFPGEDVFIADIPNSELAEVLSIVALDCDFMLQDEFPLRGAMGQKKFETN